ncbi:MAG: leucine-rich repeat protein [Lachnospiraceae bacterium]|nr:leucine-rich repeat protein [Lachnospiraceae bacterium]
MKNKTKIISLAFFTIAAAGAATFAINSLNTSKASAANAIPDSKGITKDGFVYSIKNGEAAITGYSFNPENNTFYGAKGSNGHYYGVSTMAATYDEAKAICEERGGHLVTIDTYSEKYDMDEFAEMINYPFFIGGNSVSTRICAEEKLPTFSWIFGTWQPPFATIENEENYPLVMTNEQLVDLSNPNNYYEGWEDNYYGYTKLNITTYFVCEWDENEPQDYHEVKRDFVIPKTINGAPVTSLSKKAFPTTNGDNTYLNSVTINAKIKTLEAGIFENAFSLTSVKLPSTLVTIEEKAFYDCRSLTSITIPDKVTTIGDSAFARTNLDTLKLGKRVKTIGDYAFFNNELEEVTIPASVRTIGEGAFLLNYPLKKVTMENGVTTIKRGAFDCCINLETINFPSSLKSLAGDVIRRTDVDTLYVPANAKLNFDISDPIWSKIDPKDGYLSIGYYRQLSSSTLFNVVFEDGRKTIEANAVKNVGAYIVVVPKSVTTIKKDAFANSGNGPWAYRSINNLYLPDTFKNKSEEYLKDICGGRIDDINIHFYSDNSEWEDKLMHF